MKSIVFVDDEPALLEGLRVRLYKHRHDWAMPQHPCVDEQASWSRALHVGTVMRFTHSLNHAQLPKQSAP
jgi:hypothetical protein